MGKKTPKKPQKTFFPFKDPHIQVRCFSRLCVILVAGVWSFSFSFLLLLSVCVFIDFRAGTYALCNYCVLLDFGCSLYCSTWNISLQACLQFCTLLGVFEGALLIHFLRRSAMHRFVVRYCFVNIQWLSLYWWWSSLFSLCAPARLLVGSTYNGEPTLRDEAIHMDKDQCTQGKGLHGTTLEKYLSISSVFIWVSILALVTGNA